MCACPHTVPATDAQLEVIEVLVRWRLAIMMYHDLGEIKSVSGTEIRVIEHVCKQLAGFASAHTAKEDTNVRLVARIDEHAAGPALHALLRSRWRYEHAVLLPRPCS